MFFIEDRHTQKHEQKKLNSSNAPNVSQFIFLQNLSEFGQAKINQIGVFVEKNSLFLLKNHIPLQGFRPSKSTPTGVGI